MSTPLVFEGEYAPMKMIERAVRNARNRGIGQAPRWVAVRDALGYGSTTSAQLCEHFGLDPHEMVDGDTEAENALKHQAKLIEAYEEQALEDGHD